MFVARTSFCPLYALSKSFMAEVFKNIGKNLGDRMTCAYLPSVHPPPSQIYLVISNFIDYDFFLCCVP
jgi:hypothetical protein